MNLQLCATLNCATPICHCKQFYRPVQSPLITLVLRLTVNGRFLCTFRCMSRHIIMITQFYRDKCVLLTGVTGFVGKVMLEKLLWSCPDVARVYVFIRPKKGTDAAERFSKDVLESPGFDRLRKRYPTFQSFVESKLRLIPADLQKEGLGLSPEDEAELVANLDVILNVAASVDFNLRLDQALQINTFGAIRMLTLAQKCPKLVVFVHTSTAYVNCTLDRFIDEKIYPMDRDPTAYINEIVKIPAQDIERETPKIIGKFPNTYTFTKNIGEQMLSRLRNNLSIVIARPTVIGGSLREPFQGWVDNVSAAGAFYLSAGLGLLKVGIGNLNNIGDQIPVDFVGNTILGAAGQLACTEDSQYWDKRVEPCYLENVSRRSRRLFPRPSNRESNRQKFLPYVQKPKSLRTCSLRSTHYPSFLLSTNIEADGESVYDKKCTQVPKGAETGTVHCEGVLPLYKARVDFFKPRSDRPIRADDSC